MPEYLTALAIEHSTEVITVRFLDEDENPVAPNTAVWTLTTGDGEVVNNRFRVAITSPSSVENIVLTGADLQILGNTLREFRVLTVEATYNSSYGTALSLVNSVSFWVSNLPAINRNVVLVVADTHSIQTGTDPLSVFTL